MPNFIANKKQRNQTMTGSNTHHGLLASGQAKATWAKYLSKWVTAYEAQLDTKLWGVTVQVRDKERSEESYTDTAAGVVCLSITVLCRCWLV